MIGNIFKSSGIVCQQSCTLQSWHLCLDCLKIMIEISLDYTTLLRRLLKAQNSFAPDLVLTGRTVAKTDQEKADLNQFFVPQSKKSAGVNGPLLDTHTIANLVSKLPE